MVTVVVHGGGGGGGGACLLLRLELRGLGFSLYSTRKTPQGTELLGSLWSPLLLPLHRIG